MKKIYKKIKVSDSSKIKFEKYLDIFNLIRAYLVIPVAILLYLNGSLGDFSNLSNNSISGHVIDLNSVNINVNNEICYNSFGKIIFEPLSMNNSISNIDFINYTINPGNYSSGGLIKENDYYSSYIIFNETGDYNIKVIAEQDGKYVYSNKSFQVVDCSASQGYQRFFNDASDLFLKYWWIVVIFFIVSLIIYLGYKINRINNHKLK